MPRHFLLYWRPDTVQRHLNENYLLNHAGSNQLGRVLPNDVLWIVTTGEANELGLVGKLRVAEVVSLGEAKRRLRRDDLWGSRFHALAVPGTAELMRGISLFDFADNLIFADGGATRLTAANGCIQPAELKTMRVLSPESAALLNQIWAAAGLTFVR